MTLRPVVPCLIVLALGFSGLSAQSPDGTVLQRLLVAEDSRGKGTDGLAPLFEGLKSQDSLIRRVAARGLGRLQRPDLGVALIPLLGDSVPAIRGEAAIAMAQSLRSLLRGAPVADSSHLTVAKGHHLLTNAIARESNDSIAGVIAEAIGRLQLVDSVEGRLAERAIVSRAGSRLNYGMAHGLFWLALARRFSGGLSAPSLTLLREAALTAADTNLRRMAVLTLSRADALDSTTTRAASRDQDPQVRRLALAGVARGPDQVRLELVTRALADSSVVVRVAAVGTARISPDCSPLIAALKDPHPYVILAAIDALGQPCANQGQANAMLATITGYRGEDAAGDPRGWQANAHALVSLARVDTAKATSFLPRFAGSNLWQERLYAARAAGILRNAPALYRLAGDRDNNVREAAIAGLDSIVKHEGDSVYLAALSASGNQVLLAAGEALKGSTHPRALETILDAFDRISRRRSENDRDPRLSLLSRIGEMGSTANTTRLRPYLADFDTTVAKNTAAILSRWTGTPVEAHPAPLPIEVEPLASYFAAGTIVVKVTMTRASGGGMFLVRLFPRETPATVARILRRARENYYNGHLFQRVEPNFVIQGGGPDASEYVGDDTFMRDEVGFHSHYRGTLGISTRGRDTGDAQVFINLVDNPLLDHEFTVFGQVIEGMDVVDGILEGDAIATVEVLTQ